MDDRSEPDNRNANAQDTPTEPPRNKSGAESPKQKSVTGHHKRKAKKFAWGILLNPIKQAIKQAVLFLDKFDGAVTAAATVAIAGLTLILALYAGGQLIIMGGQLTEMRSSSTQTAALITANEQLANAASRQARANVENALTAHEQIEISNRAWLGVLGAEIDYEPSNGKPLSITVKYANSGHQPAVRVKTFWDTFVASGDIDAPKGILSQRMGYIYSQCGNASTDTDNQVVFPVGNNFIPSKYIIPGDYIDEKFMRGQRIAVVLVCYAYSTFGLTRQSGACMFYVHGAPEGKSLKPCNGGNYAN